jgi:chromosome segregation protein
VLDELDAPLDESNINRFVKVLDRFIDHSQFIIVTHSKRTMARADVMYGVTMEEFGVSKPVGMRLTHSDGGATKNEAKSAAQKAALRLDA